MSIPAPVAIVGAGYLGARLARRLAAQAIPVVATSRTASAPAPAPGVQMRALDILRDSPAELRERLDGARAVVLCFSSGGNQDRRRLYVDGGQRIAEACARLQLDRVVYTSSTSALPELDAVLDEDCDAWPESERGRIQREAEDVMVRCFSASAIPWSILRLAGLYGPDRALGRIYRSDPTRVLAGDGMRPTNLIHVHDATTAIVAALGLASTRSGIVQVCDDDHTPRREMYARVAAAAGMPAPRWEVDAAPDARPRGKTVDNTRMKRILGVELAHPTHLLQV